MCETLENMSYFVSCEELSARGGENFLLARYFFPLHLARRNFLDITWYFLCSIYTVQEFVSSLFALY